MSFPALFRSGPPKPSRPLRARAFARGVERLTIPAGGFRQVDLAPEDQIEIVNDEGGQRCEIVVFHPDGRVDGGILGLNATEEPVGLRAQMTPVLAEKLRARGLDLVCAKAAYLFDPTTKSGASVTLTARSIAHTILTAPAPPMDPSAQYTATPLTLRITRKTPNATPRFALPEPLAQPLFESRIPSAQARAYRVKAGEYLQIIDIDGRQCTDFQAFDARKLDRGIIHPLDVTTTRTLQGHAYPMPGLHGKYFDEGMTPLVEVIQDTCGRHDAFAMACAAKYYDDIGYLGHANCTANFNAALAEFDVPAREGWMAANFFFNTQIDAQGVLLADEPWSRPGDYVLLRALTDLVCVSSACPDDTSPANGWDLTDIALRRYAPTERFSRAVAWRAHPDAEPQMTIESAFHQDFAALTQDFVEYKGFWLPNSFAQTDPVESYWACREGVVVMDLSALRKVEITGPDAQALCDWVLTRDISKLGQGQVVYSAMCYPHGGMVDDGTLMRLGAQNFRWIGGSDLGAEWMRQQAAALGLEVLVRNSTDQLHNIAVQGPKSRALMAEIIWTAPHQTPLADLGWFRFTVARIGGPLGAPVVDSRTGYTGELGYEIFCHPKDARAVFAALWQAGQGHGIRPMGLAGLDLVRIEAGLVFAGYEFSDQTDPFEAGIGFTVPLKSKAADFIGRAALMRRKQTPARKLVGLVIAGQEPVAHGAAVKVGRAQLGEITSAMRSPMRGEMIALARVDVSLMPGQEVEVGLLDGGIKRLPARITPFPHYDPTKERPRS